MQYWNHFPLRLRSSGMWHHADWHINVNISEGHASRVCFARLFVSFLLPSFFCIILSFFSLVWIFCLSICTHFQCVYLSRSFFTAISLFLPCYVFPRLLSLSAHTSVIGSDDVVFLLSMYVSESVMFPLPNMMWHRSFDIGVRFSVG